MSLLLKTIFNQISFVTEKKNSLLMLLSHSITRGKIISGKNLPKNARKKLNTPKRSVNLLCRLTGSKKNLKKLSDLTTRVNLVRNLSTTKVLTICIRIILLGEPVRCLLNLNCADIRLVDRCKAGKSRWADNIMSARWFCRFKYEETYCKSYQQ